MYELNGFSLSRFLGTSLLVFLFFADREEQITGVFMTAQAVAKEMIRHGRGGSIAMIASMSGSVANRVSAEIIDRQSTV